LCCRTGCCDWPRCRTLSHNSACNSQGSCPSDQTPDHSFFARSWARFRARARARSRCNSGVTRIVGVALRVTINCTTAEENIVTATSNGFAGRLVIRVSLARLFPGHRGATTTTAASNSGCHSVDCPIIESAIVGTPPATVVTVGSAPRLGHVVGTCAASRALPIAGLVDAPRLRRRSRRRGRRRCRRWRKRRCRRWRRRRCRRRGRCRRRRRNKSGVARVRWGSGVARVRC